MYTKDYIGERIKARRTALNLTQKELAAKINFGAPAPHTQITQWENSEKTPGTDALIRLCNALDCDMDYLLGAIDDTRRAAYDARETTGLDTMAIEHLIELKKAGADSGLNIINQILNDDRFYYVLKSINNARYIEDHLSSKKSSKLLQQLERIQKMMNIANAHGVGSTKKIVVDGEVARDTHIKNASDAMSMIFRSIIDREPFKVKESNKKRQKNKRS